MPPILSINNVNYQVRIKWMLHGQECFNVLNFHNTGSQDIIENLVQPILDCIVSHLLPVLSNELTLLGADFRAITGSTLQEGEVTLDDDNVGEEAVNSLPSTNAAVLALKSEHFGRTGRGRMFIPGIDESHQANSELDPAFIVAAVAFLACMADAFIAGDPVPANFFHWSVFSRKDNQFYPIKTTAVRTVIGTMRSRKVG